MNKRTYLYLNKDKAIPSPAGEAFKDRNMLVKDGNNLSLKKLGVINIVEQIQSHRDGVDLGRMIERFKRGDVNALSRGAGFYGDVSGYETDPAAVIKNGRALVQNLSEMEKARAVSEQDPKDGSTKNVENLSENGNAVKEEIANA